MLGGEVAFYGVVTPAGIAVPSQSKKKASFLASRLLPFLTAPQFQQVRAIIHPFAEHLAVRIIVRRILHNILDLAGTIRNGVENDAGVAEMVVTDRTSPQVQLTSYCQRESAFR